MPNISVILPAFNAQAYLREAIDSILNQTYTDFEFLIYNDGSTDSTKTIIDSYNDKRIKAFHSDENKGYVHWLNIGLKGAQGKYIARMDADDISLPERFQLQWDFMESHPEVGVCGGQVEIIGSGELVKKPLTDNEIRWWFFKGNPLAHPSVMIRKSVLDSSNIQYDSTLRPAEDYDMWWRLAMHTKLANLNDIILKYRYHSTQESTASADIQNIHHQHSFLSFCSRLGINIDKFPINKVKELFDKTLPFSGNQIQWLNAFFLELKRNKRAIQYFGKDSIEFKHHLLLSYYLLNVQKYSPAMLHVLTSKFARNVFDKLGIKQVNYFIKCILFWKTRQ